MFDDFIRGCARDSVVAQEYRYCQTCERTVRVGEACLHCEEKRQEREARNDSGVDFE